jgi:hypothetical protein
MSDKQDGPTTIRQLLQAAGSRRSVVEWKVQESLPRDQFEACTLTVEQWLANTDGSGFGLDSRLGKWRAFMQACALAFPGVQSQDGLRGEPRVGYDPASDQPIFIFKADNNGTTYIVSPFGVNGLEQP